MTSEKFGFKTKKIWVLKADESDAKDMANLYRNIKVEEVKTLRSLLIKHGGNYVAFLGKGNKVKSNQLDNEEIAQCMERWLQRIKLNKDDYYKHVIYVVRDRSRKAIGILETLSDDGLKTEMQIWIPSEFKRHEFLEEVVESMKEWLAEYEEYEEVTKIMLGDAIGREIECLETNYKCVS